NRLRRVDQEVDAVHAAGFPAPERARDALGAAETEPLAGLLGGLRPRRLTAQLRQEAERRVRLRRIRLAHRHELGREVVEVVRHLAPGLERDGVVLVAVEEVHGRDLVVDELADRLAELDAAAILRDALLLLGELAEREAEAA